MPRIVQGEKAKVIMLMSKAMVVTVVYRSNKEVARVSGEATI